MKDEIKNIEDLEKAIKGHLRLSCRSDKYGDNKTMKLVWLNNPNEEVIDNNVDDNNFTVIDKINYR